jgi:hypothetical protein
MNCERFDHNGAEVVLDQKGLLNELNYMITNLESAKGNSTTDKIEDMLDRLEWKRKVVLFNGTGYAHDGFKDRVMLESDQSSLDSVHRNFLRAQVLYSEKIIDCLIQIVKIGKGEPRFDHMKRDIGLFSRVLSVPIYLIGLANL